MSAQKRSTGLIFIPDISGFTRFVNETEISHSQHIIKELIELILSRNKLDLQVSEIEGDAILFFRFGVAPKPALIADQTRSMFIAFHGFLKQIERDRVCQCGACSTASRLTLKFVVHYGEFALSEINGHEKLLGSTVIAAHRLMKNEIPGNEYLLITNAYPGMANVAEVAQEFNWDRLNPGESTYEHIGLISYRYIMLTKLHEQVPDPEPLPEPVRYPDPILTQIFIDAHFAHVYNLATDIRLRVDWTDGLRGVQYDPGEIVRIGSGHRCETPTGIIDFITVQNKVEKNKIEYSEQMLNSPLTSEAYTIMSFEKQGEGTMFTLAFHYKRRKLIGGLIDLLFRKLMIKKQQKNLELLKNICERDQLQPV